MHLGAGEPPQCIPPGSPFSISLIARPMAARRRSTRSSLKDSPGGAPRKPRQPARMSVTLPLARESINGAAGSLGLPPSVVAASESPSPTVARVEFSIKHRRQIGAVGFVVETDRHQFIWCTRRRPFSRHQRNTSPLRVGSRNPPPPKPGAAPMTANRDRPDAGDRPTFVEKITTDDLSFLLGHYRVEARIRQHHRQETRRYLCRWKIPGEIVSIVDCLECFEADWAADSGIRGCTRSQHYAHGSPCAELALYSRSFIDATAQLLCGCASEARIAPSLSAGRSMAPATA